jgi:Calcineurin-like phosphoesterase
MERIGIIHLSDTQFGPKHKFGDPSKFAEGLMADVLELSQKHSFLPTSIVLSGDVTEFSIKSQYDEAQKQLSLLRNEIFIDNDMMLVVPGNHDVNWKLSELAEELGDENLKFDPYRKGLSNINDSYTYDNDYYPVVNDYQHGITYLLLNTCENETHLHHEGYVDEQKIVNSLKHIEKEDNNFLQIALGHHPLKDVNDEGRACIANATAIESLLVENKFHMYLFGHVHQNCHYNISHQGNDLICIGSGSSGVNFTEREDGIQNQYIIHVLDFDYEKIEVYCRAFNPRSIHKYGKGKWVKDNTWEDGYLNFRLKLAPKALILKENLSFDEKLISTLNIRSNPFTYSNAEKISINLISHLFVSSPSRHITSGSLTGDAIIRGKRGSGKTMLLKYLEISARLKFRNDISTRRTSSVLPVLVDLSRIHKSDLTDDIDTVYSAADKLIYDSVMNELEKLNSELGVSSYKSSFNKLRQRLQHLASQEGTLVAKLGQAINENMGSIFNHILLLIDEVAPVFPKSFFTDAENGFLRWMNSIRNSGPFFTRVAIYPSDISDKLNEERYGTVVNLDYDVMSENDYEEFYQYCVNLVNRYLSSVSNGEKSLPTVQSIIYVEKNNPDDAFEQLIYASDGSTRRFLTLMDRAIVQLYNRRKSGDLDIILSKQDVLEIISSYAQASFSGYDPYIQELSKSIAKFCKRQTAFRFKFPNYPRAVDKLNYSREELNIIKRVEVGKGKRATTFEFNYPYCILLNLQTHYIKDSRKICSSRSRVEGEWIRTSTKIKKDNLEYFSENSRKYGYIFQIEDELAVILNEDGIEYIAEIEGHEFSVKDQVTFIGNDGVAEDLVLIQ